MKYDSIIIRLKPNNSKGDIERQQKRKRSNIVFSDNRSNSIDKDQEVAYIHASKRSFRELRRIGGKCIQLESSASTMIHSLSSVGWHIMRSGM